MAREHGDETIRFVCSQCGSDEVSIDASLYWDVDEQEWMPSEIYERGDCASCESIGFSFDKQVLVCVRPVHTTEHTPECWEVE
jgi:hypothetical protein